MNAALMTEEEREQLLRNGEEQKAARERGQAIDFRPVAKLFTPDAECSWLLSELYPADPDVAFGLCDLGMGCPESGDVRLSELAVLRGRLGLPVERDLYFTAEKTLGDYAREAYAASPNSLCRRAPARLSQCSVPIHRPSDVDPIDVVPLVG